jgi:hypothetical protein
VAVPDEGYRFGEWTAHVGTITDIYDPTTTITMNGDYAIVANFLDTQEGKPCNCRYQSLDLTLLPGH